MKGFSLMIDRHGQCLGNYRLMSLLGRGGFAEVYLGEHIYLKTQAAVKILQAHLLKAEDQEDFLREAQTIARLAHPHIVRIFDFGVEIQTPYLAMEYAPGGTLRQSHPRGERLELPAVVAYVRQVAEALHYIHNERLIHRDVKPENMLVGKSNEILLGDFGIALVTQSSRYQSTQSVVGTVAYMAPEQIQGQPRPASDQYSLAIVVYEWLCGQRPFSGSFTELCMQHMFAPVPALRAKGSSIAPEVEEVIMTALAKDPKERFASIAAFATALEQAAKITWNSSPPQAVPLSSGIQSPGAPTAPVLNSSPNQPLVAAAHKATPSAQVMTARQPPTTPSAPVRSAVSRISRRTLLTTGGIGLGAVALGGTLFGLIERASHSDSFVSTPTPSLPRNLLFVYQGHSTTTNDKNIQLRWSPDSTRIMSTDGETVQVWDAFDGKHASTYHLLNISRFVGDTFDIAWTTNGPCVAQMDLNTHLI